jgi:hypothetical protein
MANDLPNKGGAVMPAFTKLLSKNAFDIKDADIPSDEKCEGKVDNVEIAKGGKFYIKHVNSNLYIGIDDKDENRLKMYEIDTKFPQLF